MFAIVSIAGQQFKVEEGKQIFVHPLDAKQGDKVSFDQVLLTSADSSTSLGTPFLEGYSIGATVLEEMVKGDKVVVFKKKRRKGYRLKKGHRQQFTLLEINSITSGNGSAKKAQKAEPAKPAEEPVKETAKANAKETVQDDLTLLEGIGPKVLELFQKNGISTFAELAATSADDLKKILDEEGGAYQTMDPTTLSLIHI